MKKAFKNHFIFKQTKQTFHRLQVPTVRSILCFRGPVREAGLKEITKPEQTSNPSWEVWCPRNPSRYLSCLPVHQPQPTTTQVKGAYSSQHTQLQRQWCSSPCFACKRLFSHCYFVLLCSACHAAGTPPLPNTLLPSPSSKHFLKCLVSELQPPAHQGKYLGLDVAPVCNRKAIRGTSMWTVIWLRRGPDSLWQSSLLAIKFHLLLSGSSIFSLLTFLKN